MDAIKVDIGKFREELTNLIASNAPIAVIQNGHTVGYFIPTQEPGAADVAALTKAREAFDLSLAGTEIDIEEAVAEFDALRKHGTRRKRSGSRAA